MSTTAPTSGLAARGLQGVLGDLRRRGATYASDWKDGLNAKVPAATLFLFFACLAPAIAFGGLMSSATEGAIGVMEMLLATAACGVVYALVAGQPLTILGGTVPLLVFTGILYGVCRRYGLPFLSTYAWVGIWASGFTLVLAFAGVSRLIARFTRFTDETFAALISIIFVVEAVRNVLSAFPTRHISDDSALLGVILALGTYVVASALARLRHTPLPANIDAQCPRG
ncbi:MAG: HCO3- transporter, partial [Deltaproteobacteria bacterium]|nr:HCO3- transporter [Deltaproteobacteria bacterium]